MKKIVVVCTALAIQLSGLSACGSGPTKKESQRSTGATETVIARVDKKATQEGGTAITFSSTNKQTATLNDAASAETAFLTGQKINFENKLADAPATTTTADASKPPVYTPVEPYPPVVQHPGQKPPVAQQPINLPVYPPVAQHPGQHPDCGQKIGCGPGVGVEPIGPGHCVDPCRPVACGCGWDFPILRAAGRIAWAAGSFIFWWGNNVAINTVSVNTHYDDYSEPYVGQNTPVQKGFAGDTYMKQYAPTFKGDAHSGDGKSVNYSFSHTVEGADALYYIYSR